MPDRPDRSSHEPQPTADAPAASSASPAAEGTRLPGADAEPLDERTAARWNTARGALAALAGSITDQGANADDIVATQGQLDALDLDLATVRDALHIPDDAGPYRDGLERILRRIPDGWGRWISCGPGWYPLLVELDVQLAAIDPGYVVHQVKEKFGTLRFYAEPRDSGTVDGSIPDRADEDDLGERRGTAVDAAAFREAIRGAENRSARTCELTGEPGILMRNQHGYYRTLDPCTAPDGYEIVPPCPIGPVLAAAADDPKRLRLLVEDLAESRDHWAAIAQRLLFEQADRSDRPDSDEA